MPLKYERITRNRLLSHEAMACTRILGVSTGPSFPGGLRYRMRRFQTTETHNEWIALPESGRIGGNGVTVEGHGLFFPRHSSFWAEPALVTLSSCPLWRAMTGSEQGSRIVILCTSWPRHVLWYPQLKSQGRGIIGNQMLSYCSLS